MLDQKGGTLEGVADDRFGAFFPIGEMGGVAEIDDRLVGQQILDGAHHGQAAKARVQDADRLTHRLFLVLAQLQSYRLPGH